MATVPVIPLRTLESYLDRIEALRRDATSDELPMLAYLLECAKLEAQNLLDAAGREKVNREADPDDLWRPVSDQ